MPGFDVIGNPDFNVGTHEGIDAGGHRRVGTLVLFQTGTSGVSADGRPFRAVSRSMNSGGPRVFNVRPDRFDHEVEFSGAVDLARYAVGHIGPDELGFDEGYSAREIKTR